MAGQAMGGIRLLEKNLTYLQDIVALVGPTAVAWRDEGPREAPSDRRGRKTKTDTNPSNFLLVSITS